MDAILRCWDVNFAGCAPIGSRLRMAFPERWVRFHCLPESKRYAESETELATAVRRYDALLDDLNGSRQDVVLITTGYSDSAEPVRSYPMLREIDAAAAPWRTLRVEDADPVCWHFYASTHRWPPTHLNALLRLVAQDELANILIVAQDCSWVFYPYQGGMDVIAASVLRRDALAQSHAEWIPAGIDGL